MFSGSKDESLLQWGILRHELVRDYGRIHADGVVSLVVTGCGKYLWSIGVEGFIKKWDVEEGVLAGAYSDLLNSKGGAMRIVGDGGKVFLGCGGRLMQYHLEKKRWVGDYGCVCEDDITRVVCTKDGRSVFAVSRGGTVKQFDAGTKEKMGDFNDTVNGDIKCLLLTD